MMTSTEIREIIKQVLPQALAEDPGIRDFILRTVSDYYAPKSEADLKFDRILDKLERDREEQSRKWEEQARKWEEQKQIDQQNREEQARKWEEQKQIDQQNREEQSRKWEEQKQIHLEYAQRFDRIFDKLERDREEQARKWEEQKQIDQQNREEQARKWEEQKQLNHQTLAEIKQLNRKYNSTIGALGARWGLHSEASFRNALKGILTDSFAVEVLNVNDFDPDGDVFGRPDQVEIDVIIQNGITIVCEIKSSIDKAGMYIFDRKVVFYANRYQRSVNRKLVISPMVDQNALPVAKALGIEVYSHVEDIETL
jgi:hypothetical protein